MRIAITALIFGILSVPGHANGCDTSVTANCRCLIQILEPELGASRTDLLFELWRASLDRDQTRRHKFFVEQVHEINATVLAFGRLKPLIGFQCGSLNLESDGLD